MDKKTAERVVHLMSNTPQIDTVDLTGKCSKCHYDTCHFVHEIQLTNVCTYRRRSPRNEPAL